MGYLIRYGHEERKKAAAGKSYIGWIAGCLAAAALTVGLLWPQTADLIRTILFPWLDSQTVMAFQNMIAEIGAGSPVGEALLAFCREIIGNAGILV